MMIPQIKNTALSVAVILVGVPLFTAYQLYLSGELHGWNELRDAVNHSAFSSFMMAVGWIFLKSPFAGKITELFQQTNYPSGATQATSVKITEPEPAKVQPPVV